MKKLLKKNRKVKGMTLMEVIVSMFVFSIAALLMARICTVAVQMTKNANHVNKKSSIEAPLAESANTDSSFLDDDNLKITVKIAGKDVDVAAKSYTTKSAVTGNIYAATNGDYDIEYVQVDLTKNSGAGIWTDPTLPT